MKQPLSLKLACLTLFIKTNLFCSKICQQILGVFRLKFLNTEFHRPQLWDRKNLQTGGVMHAAVQEIAVLCVCVCWCFPTIRRYLSIHLFFPKKNSYILNLFFEIGSSPKETSWWSKGCGSFCVFCGFFLLLQDLSSPPWCPPWPQAIFPLVVPTCHDSRVQDRATQPFINEVDIDTSSRNQLPGLLTCYWSLDLSPNPLQMGAYSITKKTVLSRCPDFPMISLLTSAPWTLWMSKSKQNWAILYFWFFSFNGITGSASSFTFAPFDRVQINPT